mmetsp:Transcript_16423/g.52439  ORF Transcript_16423/g.52439 Transcript_16423/m.52439 type:complete len:209 (+) Transcript_16423:223-849(+)
MPTGITWHGDSEAYEERRDNSSSRLVAHCWGTAVGACLPSRDLAGCAAEQHEGHEKRLHRPVGRQRRGATREDADANSLAEIAAAAAAAASASATGSASAASAASSAAGASAAEASGAAFLRGERIEATFPRYDSFFSSTAGAASTAASTASAAPSTASVAASTSSAAASTGAPATSPSPSRSLPTLVSSLSIAVSTAPSGTSGRGER